MRNIYSFFFFYFYSIISFAQGLNNGVILQDDYFEKIEFEKDKNLIFVNVIIEGNKYRFLFDTGAPFAISKKLFDKFNLAELGQTEVSDSDGRTSVMSFTILPNLNLGSITFENSHGFVLGEASAKLFECLGVEGIIGSNMLRNSIVQFDDVNNLIILTNKIGNLDVKDEAFQDLMISEVQSRPYVKIYLGNADDNVIEEFVLFDTGADSFYEMSINTLEWMQENDINLIHVLKESAGTFGWGVHGPAQIETRCLLDIPRIYFKNDAFKNIRTTITNDGSSRFGVVFLKYGKVTIDYLNKRFYFIPFKVIGEIEESIWSITPTFLNDKLAVGIVWDKELEGQVSVGDEILKIDQYDCSKMTFCESIGFDFLSLFHENTYIELKDFSTGEIKSIKINRI